MIDAREVAKAAEAAEASAQVMVVMVVMVVVMVVMMVVMVVMGMVGKMQQIQSERKLLVCIALGVDVWVVALKVVEVRVAEVETGVMVVSLVAPVDSAVVRSRSVVHRSKSHHLQSNHRGPSALPRDIGRRKNHRELLRRVQLCRLGHRHSGRRMTRCLSLAVQNLDFLHTRLPQSAPLVRRSD